MALRTPGDDEEMMSDINVTPLVDVMLVLLVVFIVTAPLLTNAVRVNLPKTAVTAPAEQKRTVTVSVDAQGKVFFDQREVPLEAVELELRQLKAVDPDPTLHLQADQAVPYGQVAKVMAAIERAGVNRLSILTAAE